MTVTEVEEAAPAAAPRRPRARLVVALVLVTAALAYAVWSGVSWWLAAAGAADRAQARDEVLRAGERGVATLTTMDHTRFGAGMSRWRDTATGALRDSLVQDTGETEARIEQQRASTRGRVVDAAVTELDEQAGAATVIAAVEVTVTPEGGESSVRRNRFRAELTRTDEGWKLSALTAVGVGAS